VSSPNVGQLTEPLRGSLEPAGAPVVPYCWRTTAEPALPAPGRRPEVRPTLHRRHGSTYHPVHVRGSDRPARPDPGTRHPGRGHRTSGPGRAPRPHGLRSRAGPTTPPRSPRPCFANASRCTGRRDPPPAWSPYVVQVDASRTLRHRARSPGGWSLVLARRGDTIRFLTGPEAHPDPAENPSPTLALLHSNYET